MNALVLSGGGARASYQAGVLQLISEKAPETEFPIVTGVSAGAINAAFLAGHRGHLADGATQLASHWRRLTIDHVFRTDPLSLAGSALRWIWRLAGGGTRLTPSVKGLVNTRPLRSFLLDCIDFDGIRHNIDTGRLRAAALTATSFGNGLTFTFVQGPEDIPVWERVQRRGLRATLTIDHVMASCAIPLIFPAIRVADDFFGDGSVRQAAPLAPAIHLGADRLLAIGTRYLMSGDEAADRVITGYPPPTQVLSLLLNSIFLDALEADAERLERINHLLLASPPHVRASSGLRPVKFLILRPSRDLGRLALEYRTKLPRTIRFLLRGLGTHQVRSSDLLSYLLFEDPYVSYLIELGYEDARRDWPSIARFLDEDARDIGQTEKLASSD